MGCQFSKKPFANPILLDQENIKQTERKYYYIRLLEYYFYFDIVGPIEKYDIHILQDELKDVIQNFYQYSNSTIENIIIGYDIIYNDISTS